MEKDTMKEVFGKVIYSYTRAQAIADGVLVDVSNMAQEAGFRFPVAITASVWHDYVVPNDELISYGQSYEGRLWDVLWMLRYCASRKPGDIVMFKLYFVMLQNGNPIEQVVQLKAICGPGELGEPVITILKPEED